MVDFIKFYAIDKERFDLGVLGNDTLSLSSTYDIKTGEANEFPKSGRFENIEMRLTEKSTYLKGSLHKMYNKIEHRGIHNYNDFNHCQIQDAIGLLSEKFVVHPQMTKITNLEFGMNICLPYDPAKFVNNSLLMYDFNDHTINKNFNNKGDYKEFQRSDYSIKIYNKSKQYRYSGNILRVEVKIIKRRVLERLDIFSLEDLLGLEAYDRLYEFLMKCFDNLLIVDSEVMSTALRTSEINMLKNYTNPHYWINLKSRLSTQEYYKRRRACHKYLRMFSVDTSKKEVKLLLRKKYLFLMGCEKDSYLMAA